MRGTDYVADTDKARTAQIGLVHIVVASPPI